MFGFSLAAQLFQGSAQRTWNCVTQFTNLLWYKFNHFRHPIMPRSRRRHHSRSRSRSHSHDRDREPKRRKIESVDSPNHKRSVSCEPEMEVEAASKSQTEPTVAKQQLEEKLTITPKKAMSPKQLAKKLESEKRRQQKQLERDEREKKRQEEKERVRLEKLKQKEEKDKEKQQKEEQRQKERELKEEQKRKEREEKEAKRKEKEEREELKRKEREQDKLRKQQEIEEKNKEKQKLEEKKQKTVAAFVSFFVKKTEAKVGDEAKTSKFMPFQVKSDMRLAPVTKRPVLSEDEKSKLDDHLANQSENVSYLDDLKNGKQIGKAAKTWPYEDDDVIVVEEDFGESICEEEDKIKSKKMRAKLLKFHENRRPPYFGTWRKKSKVVTPRKPLAEDKTHFDYEVDSDDDWEEEEQGESLSSDDEDNKENDGEIDDYEVDNDFFVPHGHLSDDEVDDEATARLSPESQKQKLKLLKDEFDQDMQAKTHKMKPRSIGCVWYNKRGSNVDEAIDRHLRPLAMITNGQIVIKKRKDVVSQTPNRKYAKELRKELIPTFLKLIHGNINKRKMVVDDFINWMQNNGFVVEVSKAYLGKKVKEFAQWKKCAEEGSMLNKFCWCVEDEVKKKFGVDLSLK